MALDTFAAYLTYFNLAPRQSISRSDLVMVMNVPVLLKSGQLWVGYDQGAIFEAAAKVWLNPKTPTGFSGAVFLGGVYYHKHTAANAYQDDYRPLQELKDLQPIAAPAGSTITIDRDIFNINWPPVWTDPYWYTGIFNAWDCELILDVEGP